MSEPPIEARSAPDARGAVRVIVLGNEAAGDDGAALAAARIVGGIGDVEMVLAGRPGVDLIDLLDIGSPVVLVDVVHTGARPGTLIELPIDALQDRAVASAPASSHGFGPAEALALALSLGRALPRGVFLGIEGARFEAGAPFSDGVETAIPVLAAAMGRAIAALGRDACTSTA